MTTLGSIGGALALLAGVAAGPALAETVTYKADLRADTEVPPNPSKAVGHLDVTYDTASRKITYKLGYTDLTGPATMAHFHGPAKPGKNAGVLVPTSGALTSPMEGTATLTEDQAKALANGDLYFNVHTDANKSGEIRGQVVKGM